MKVVVVNTPRETMRPREDVVTTIRDRLDKSKDRYKKRRRQNFLMMMLLLCSLLSLLFASYTVWRSVTAPEIKHTTHSLAPTSIPIPTLTNHALSLSIYGTTTTDKYVIPAPWQAQYICEGTGETTNGYLTLEVWSNETSIFVSSWPCDREVHILKFSSSGTFFFMIITSQNNQSKLDVYS